MPEKEPKGELPMTITSKNPFISKSYSINRVSEVWSTSPNSYWGHDDQHYLLQLAQSYTDSDQYAHTN